MAGDASRGNRVVPEILLEVRPSAISGDLAHGLPAAEQFRRRADEVADSIAEIADRFRSGLGKYLQKPAEPGWHMESIELSFEIAVQAQAGVVVAKATSGATFSATLTMRAPESMQ